MKSILHAIANANIPVPLPIWIASRVILSAAALIVLYFALSTTFTGSNAFNNFSLSPTITDNRTYTFGSGAIEISGDLTINPDAASALALTVEMGNSITVASTKTLTITRTNSATSNLDTTANDQ